MGYRPGAKLITREFGVSKVTGKRRSAGASQPPRGAVPQAPSDEQIYRRIFSAIVEHSLLPGTKLKEEALCGIFGVGRTRIRKLLMRLANDNIVELIPNRGAFVAHPSVEEAKAVFTARRVIEGHIVEQVAAHMNPAARATLWQHLQAEEQARRRNDTAAAIRLCGGFHVVLARLAGNPILEEFMRELVSRTSLIVAIYQRVSDAGCELEEHKALVEALTDARVEGAKSIMDDHLAGIEARLDLVAPQDRTVDLEKVLALS